MLVKIVSIVVIVLWLPLCLQAQEVSSVTVTDMEFCRGIEQRNPVNAATRFPVSVERVFCYTKLSSAVEHTAISHVWYYNNTQMAIVDLPVNGKFWRTWSSKRIVKEWSGTWRVDVISSTGNVIYSDEFQIYTDTEGNDEDDKY